MADHKFKIGQTLNYQPHRTSYSAGPNKCKILKLLSTEGYDPKYRIKCLNENFDRVVEESELA